MKSKRPLFLMMFLVGCCLLFIQANCGVVHADTATQETLLEMAERAAASIYFDSGSATVADAYDDEIRKVANIMNAAPEVTAVVEGYTGRSGKKSVNLKLCKVRTENVKRYLVDKFHLDGSRVTTVECAADPGMVARMKEVNMQIPLTPPLSKGGKGGFARFVAPASGMDVKNRMRNGCVQIMLLTHRLETPTVNPEPFRLSDNVNITAQKIIVTGSGVPKGKDQNSVKMAALIDGLRNLSEGISTIKYRAAQHRANPKESYIEYEIAMRYDSLLRIIDAKCINTYDRDTIENKCRSSFSGWQLTSELKIVGFAAETDKVTLTRGKVKIVLSEFQLVSDASLQYFEAIVSMLGKMGFEISYKDSPEGIFQAELTYRAKTK